MEKVTDIVNKKTDHSKIQNQGVIEVLDNQGHVQQRSLIDNEPVTIGRGYDNTIILDDPYVCEHHVSLTLLGEQLQVEDLNSINGFFINHEHYRGISRDLISNDVIRIGHTQFRYRHASQPLQKTKVDRHVPNAFWSLQNPRLILLAFLIVAIIFAVEAIVGEIGEIDKIKVFSEVLTGIMVVLIWSGLWALFGKIMIGKLYFPTHVGIFSLASIALSILTMVLGYLLYTLGLDDRESIMTLILMALTIGVAVYAHMSYSTRLSSRRIITTCSVLVLIGVGWYLIDTHLVKSKFDQSPKYQVLLKSPDYNLVDGQSVDAFFSETSTLQEGIVNEIAEDRK